MAASKKKRTGARAAVVVVLCLVLVCVVAAAVALGLVSRRVKSFAGGASFSLDYQITSTAAEEPALYKVLAQFGGTSGRVDGQYTPEALQLKLYAAMVRRQFGLPVTEAVLYSFCLGQAVKVEL